MLRFKFDSNAQNSQKSGNNDNEMYRIENKYKKKPFIIMKIGLQTGNGIYRTMSGSAVGI